ncbi:TonB family protein [Zymobacter palmae]|nr:TonB family protein [Zymobacter palmae]
MMRQAGGSTSVSGSPLRGAASGRVYRLWCVAGVIVLHVGIVAGLWTMPLPTLTEPSSPIVIQLATVAAPHPRVQPSPADVVPPPPPPTKPTSPQPKTAPTHRSAPSRASSNGAVHHAQPSVAPTPPAGGDMLGNALADVHQQAWQSTSQRYAQDSASSVQTALSRYRQDWVRATQTYIDLHFPRTRRDARLEFNVTVDRQGRLLGLDMVHSTGDAALDAQAFKAIRAAAPFRPFDAGMGNRQTLTFRQGWVFNQGALLEP